MTLDAWAYALNDIRCVSLRLIKPKACGSLRLIKPKACGNLR